jgi:zinc protease
MRAFFRLALLAITALPTMSLADEVTSFTLDNGMQIVVIEDHRAPVVVQMVWYRTGSADELPGHSGIAHFFEHLMFKATDDLAAGEFTATVEAQGGNDNAFTSNDYTAYFQRIATDRLDLVMRMEADRMHDLQLTKDVLETEREVILEERAQRTDSDPGALLGEQMDAAQYMNHPYGIPVIGWRHEIAALSLEDADAFYRANYAPNNAILIVAGDVKPQDVLALAKLNYGPLSPSDKIKQRQRPTEPPQLAERRIVLADERVSEPYVIRTYLAPNRKSGDQAEAAALTILAELLGGNATTSVMARALQFDSQTAVWSSAFYNGSSLDPQTFGPMPGVSLADAEAAMDKVVADFIKAGVNPEELDRIKTQIRASKIYGRDDAMGLAQEYGASLAVGLTIDDIQDWPNALQAVTEADVLAAATSVFDRRNAVTGWLTPKEEAAE